jgi:hypothetical protein
MAARFRLDRPGRAIAATALLALAGCADTGDPTNSDVGKVTMLLYHEVLKIGADDSVPRERAAAVPYASLGIRLGSSTESMFVLANRSGHDLHWLGGKKLAITTRGGRVIQTVGFEHNLTGFQEIALTPPDAARSREKNYMFDFAEVSLYGVLVSCSVEDLGPEQINILGATHSTRHRAEDCTASKLDWDFRDEFWTDATGFTWKSKQYVEPDLDPLTIETLRPAAE